MGLSGGGTEPEEEPGGAAVREVCEEAGVKGKLGRLLGILEIQALKHRTHVYVLTVAEILEDWGDSGAIGRKREWFTVGDVIKVSQACPPRVSGKTNTGGFSDQWKFHGPAPPTEQCLVCDSAQPSGVPSSIRQSWAPPPCHSTPPQKPFLIFF